MSEKEKSADENKDNGYGTVRPMNKVGRELQFLNKEKKKSEKK